MAGFTRRHFLSTVLAVGAAGCAPSLIASCASHTTDKETLKYTAAKKTSFEQVGVDQISGAIAPMASAVTAFGVDLLASTRSGDAVVAPWTAFTTVSLLRAGARGATAHALDVATHAPTTLTSSPDYHKVMAGLVGELGQWQGDPGKVDTSKPPSVPVVAQSHGLFVDKSVNVDSGYLKILTKFFNSGYYPLTIDNDHTPALINEWISVNTNDQLQSPPRPFDPHARVEALDTIFFAGAWSTPFVVRDGLMRARMPAKVLRRRGWSAIELPYNGGTLAMRVVLPAGDLASVMNPAVLSDACAVADAPYSMMDVAIPQWSSDNKVDIAAVLKAKGAEQAFNHSADFGGIISAHIDLDTVGQLATLTVDTAGSLATSDSTTNTPAPPPPLSGDHTFIADRPFIYEIVDTATNIPLYLGAVSTL